MIKDLPDINMHFHAHAACYRRGDTVFLIDSSAAMQRAYDGAAIRHALECADVVQNKLCSRTRAFFFGEEKGLREISLNGATMMSDALKILGDGKECYVQPAMEQLAAEYAHCCAHKPLHVMMISGGDNNDKRYGAAYKAVCNLLEAPGTQVLFDLILVAQPHQNIMRLMSPALSHMLDGGKSKLPGKPEPLVYTAFRESEFACTIADAINKRIEPENPHRFMVDVICDVFRQGSPPDMQCPPRAIFKKKPR